MLLKSGLEKKISWLIFLVFFHFQHAAWADSTEISGVASTNSGYMVWCCTAASSENQAGYWVVTVPIVGNQDINAACGPGQAVVDFHYVSTGSTPYIYIGCAPVATSTCVWTQASACPYYGYMTPRFPQPQQNMGNNPPWPNTGILYPNGVLNFLP